MTHTVNTLYTQGMHNLQAQECTTDTIPPNGTGRGSDAKTTAPNGWLRQRQVRSSHFESKHTPIHQMAPKHVQVIDIWQFCKKSREKTVLVIKFIRDLMETKLNAAIARPDRHNCHVREQYILNVFNHCIRMRRLHTSMRMHENAYVNFKKKNVYVRRSTFELC
jgi:hypothetical protein